MLIWVLSVLSFFFWVDAEGGGLACRRTFDNEHCLFNFFFLG
jgi:hypothetical protein